MTGVDHFLPSTFYTQSWACLCVRGSNPYSGVLSTRSIRTTTNTSTSTTTKSTGSLRQPRISPFHPVKETTVAPSGRTQRQEGSPLISITPPNHRTRPRPVSLNGTLLPHYNPKTLLDFLRHSAEHDGDAKLYCPELVQTFTNHAVDGETFLRLPSAYWSRPSEQGGLFSLPIGIVMWLAKVKRDYFARKLAKLSTSQLIHLLQDELGSDWSEQDARVFVAHHIDGQALLELSSSALCSPPLSLPVGLALSISRLVHSPWSSSHGRESADTTSIPLPPLTHPLGQLTSVQMNQQLFEKLGSVWKASDGLSVADTSCFDRTQTHRIGGAALLHLSANQMAAPPLSFPIGFVSAIDRWRRIPCTESAAFLQGLNQSQLIAFLVQHFGEQTFSSYAQRIFAACKLSGKAFLELLSGSVLIHSADSLSVFVMPPFRLPLGLAFSLERLLWLSPEERIPPSEENVQAITEALKQYQPLINTHSDLPKSPSPSSPIPASFSPWVAAGSSNSTSYGIPCLPQATHVAPALPVTPAQSRNQNINVIKWVINESTAMEEETIQAVKQHLTAQGHHVREFKRSIDTKEERRLQEWDGILLCEDVGIVYLLESKHVMKMIYLKTLARNVKQFQHLLLREGDDEMRTALSGKQYVGVACGTLFPAYIMRMAHRLGLHVVYPGGQRYRFVEHPAVLKVDSELLQSDGVSSLAEEEEDTEEEEEDDVEGENNDEEEGEEEARDGTELDEEVDDDEQTPIPRLDKT